MLKNIVYSMCCTACLCSVVMCGDVTGMIRSKSFPVTDTEKRAIGVQSIGDSSAEIDRELDAASARRRSHSLPVTQYEIQEAIDQWAHLVPQDEDTTQLVNNALEDVVIHKNLAERLEKMHTLVALLCDKGYDPAYANYAQMVFVAALPDCRDEERNKFGGMLAEIADARCGGAGACSSLYWQEYRDGYYNALTSEVECSEWDSWH